MNKHYVVFGADGALVTRLPINAEVSNPLPSGTFLVDEAIWLKTIAENDGQWTRKNDGSIVKIPFSIAPKTRDEIEAYRKRAYADPLTGCDAMFAESSRMEVMGETGHEEVRTRAIARFEEIQAQYPWPSK